MDYLRDGLDMSANQQLLVAGGLYDIAPDPSIFGNQANVARSTVITSNTVVPTGYTHATSWTCSGGTASIDGGAYTTSGTISPGQSVTLRVTSSASYSTTSTVTFTVNEVASNWSVTTLAAIGQQLFTTDTNWTVPAGVQSVSVVCIGSGQTGKGANGGSLGWKNNIVVTPGQVIPIVVGTNGSDSYFSATNLVRGNGGNNGPGFAGDGGGNGGLGTNGSSGGGGAGGYDGAGGNGGSGGSSGTNGQGGGGGGGSHSGAAGGRADCGGGVGVYGKGASGSGGISAGGGGGSGGTAGGGWNSGVGGSYGGGGGGTSGSPKAGGAGAVRIIWPGNLRQFPSTRTADE